MSLTQILRIFWARRAIIALAIILCVLAAAAAGALISPRYKAHARLMLNVVKPDPVTGEVIASQFARAYTRTQTELIKDYRIAGKVVDRMGWASSPQLLEEYQDRRSDDVRDFRRWLAQLIINNTNAELIEGSNILDISYTASNPEAAALVVEAIRRAYADEMIAFRREDATSNAEWFKAQSAKLKNQLTEAENQKTAFERANRIALDEDDVDQESRRLAAIAATSPPVSSGQPVVVSNGGGGFVSNAASGQLAQINAAIASAERTLGPNHPQLVDLKRQRAAIASAPSGQASVGRPVIAGPSGPSLGSLYGAQIDKVLSQRDKLSEAKQLAVAVSVLREQYEKASKRAAELTQEAASTESGLTLLGSATAPEKPAFPNWTLILLGALGLGTVLGFLAALVTELTGRRVRSEEDLASFGIPVIGVMAEAENSRKWAWPAMFKTGKS